MTILRIVPSPNSAGLKALADLGRKARNPEGVLRNIGNALLRVTHQRFESQTGPDGTAWAPHSKLTQAIRGAGQPILRKRGNLMRSINYRVAARVLRLGPHAPPYDAVQQFGATIRPKKGKVLAIPMQAQRGGHNKVGFMFIKKAVIPPRPYIGFGPKDEAAVLREIEAWLKLEAMK